MIPRTRWQTGAAPGLLAAVVVVAVVWMRPSGPATLVMDDFEFRPAVLRLSADQDGQLLLLSNASSVAVHDFTVVGLPEDVRVHLALFEDAKDVPYHLPAIPAGTYEVYCSVPGHRDAGMEAVMLVE